MKRLFILGALALFGVLIAVAVIVQNNRTPPLEPPPVQPAASPYPSYVAGSGVVEAGTGDIAIGTPVSGIVAEIYVKRGEAVNAGQALFKIDDRDLQAQIAPARAKVGEAAAARQKAEHQLTYSEHLKRIQAQAISTEELGRLKDDATIATAALELARSELGQIEREIQRRTVRAPVSGHILQMNMRLGEFMEASAVATPLLVLGDQQRLHVRVEVDQQDAWRVRPDAAATAFERGNPGLRIPLRFEYIEPLMVPKAALTGQGTERTDTRVLQVIYGFERGDLPIYVGQQVDVYIEAAPDREDKR